MITSALILLLTSVCGILMMLLPSITIFPTAFNSAWEWITDLFANFLWTIPGSARFVSVLNFYLLLISGIFIWFSINWVINKLRGSGK